MTPELRAAHEELTLAIEKVLALEEHAEGHATEDDPLYAMEFLIVVFSKNMNMVERNHSGYSYLMKDGGHEMPAHHAQGLAQRLYDWANDDEGSEV